MCAVGCKDHNGMRRVGLVASQKMLGVGMVVLCNFRHIGHLGALPLELWFSRSARYSYWLH